MKSIAGENKDYDGVKDQIIAALPDRVKDRSFDAIRQEAGKTEKEWPDGFIEQAAKDAGKFVGV